MHTGVLQKILRAPISNTPPYKRPDYYFNGEEKVLRFSVQTSQIYTVDECHPSCRRRKVFQAATRPKKVGRMQSPSKCEVHFQLLSFSYIDKTVYLLRKDKVISSLIASNPTGTSKRQKPIGSVL